MTEPTEDQRTELVMSRVGTIYRALIHGAGKVISPEELAAQHYACLLAASGLRLRAAGYRPWTPGGDELVHEMAAAAAEAIEAACDRAVAARN